MGKIEQQSQSAPAHSRRTPLLDLFPEITPYASGFLDVDSTHSLYWEQSGNEHGMPVLILHGGPGAGATPAHRRFFDPDHYRIIIFDQRGCGRSHPFGNLKNNTTEHLIDDIETLRKHLRIKRWHLFGGSWGSTLALHYAAAHPTRCISLILRAIFLCEQDEIDWFLYGIKNIFPEAWQHFASFAPKNRRNDLLNVYYDALTCGDPETETNAAVHWSLYESACASLLPNFETLTTDEQKQHAWALARIEAHYFKNQVLPTKHSLLNKIAALRKVPAVIIQGRYDVVCPIKTAYKLHQAWPEADYIVVPDAGHSATDPPLRSRLIEATQHFKTL